MFHWASFRCLEGVNGITYHSQCNRLCSFPCYVSGRYIVQSLPALLVGIATVVLLATKAVQLFQVHVLHKLPWGSLSRFSVTDTCVGIVVMGLFVLYFGGWSHWTDAPVCWPCCVHTMSL